MTMPAPTLEYDVSLPSVTAHGLSYTNQQLDQILSGPVKMILQDATGQAELTDLLAGLVTTEFELGELTEVLAEECEFEDWLIGEAIAEAFVAERGRCEYPWPTSRDLKNSNASPAGCDLTGLQLLDDQELPYRFSFGEVKTSYDQNSPPSVMTSLGNQLFGLRDNKSVKNELVKYLGRHALGKPWLSKYKSAATRYFRSGGTDIAVYGVLVRDTPPRDADIRGKARALAVNCPEATDIEFHAVHIPAGEIINLPVRAQSAMNGEGEA
ncbi:hypothetical protein JK188_03650 [Providencia sp. JGM181]|uniref:hypothetical protein n=1 Tax=unclassified Providencia TaxID=2633465 RepID=UPI001BA967FB|nr:hypothetical protein [Providencia sp. JGM181]MBS0934619.1 hypothetical protein [Providencia sp. JGM172]MBS0998437.1 hypothetical protein [Providencia sp. JGM178]